MLDISERRLFQHNRREAVIQKLRLDFTRETALPGAVEIDGPQSELILGLLLEAGRVMEDNAPELALRLPDSVDDIRERVTRLARSASVLSALAAAAAALLETPVAR